MQLLELLKALNEDYANLLNAFAALLLMIITFGYAKVTKRQMVISEKSVHEMQKQLRLEQQPVIVIDRIETYGTEVFTESGRRQLSVHIFISNVGNAPALSLYVFSHFELQHILNENGDNKKVNMYYLPDHLNYLDNKGACETSVRYEEHEIDFLVKDLFIAHKKNMNRLAVNPSQPAYKGTTLCIEVYYKNLLNQWFCLEYKTNIVWLEDINAEERKTNDINENTIPPCNLTERTRFKLRLTSMLLSASNHRMIQDHEIYEKLEQYSEEMQLL